MSDADIFAKSARALFGAAYAAPMAEFLGVNKSAVEGWRDGKAPVPPGIWALVHDALIAREPEVRSALQDVRWRPEALKGLLATNSRRNRETGCLEWTGKLKTSGYGFLSIKRKVVSAHRLAWELVHGAIPADQVVCHSCDNPKCIEVSHLWLGTQADNIRDMDIKGRANRRIGRKLTNEITAAILADDRPRKIISAEYGISPQLVGHIKQGRKPSYRYVASVLHSQSALLRQVRMQRCESPHPSEGAC